MNVAFNDGARPRRNEWVAHRQPRHGRRELLLQFLQKERRSEAEAAFNRVLPGDLVQAEHILIVAAARECCRREAFATQSAKEDSQQRSGALIPRLSKTPNCISACQLRI